MSSRTPKQKSISSFFASKSATKQVKVEEPDENAAPADAGAAPATPASAAKPKTTTPKAATKATTPKAVPPATATPATPAAATSPKSVASSSRRGRPSNFSKTAATAKTAEKEVKKEPEEEREEKPETQSKKSKRTAGQKSIESGSVASSLNDDEDFDSDDSFGSMDDDDDDDLDDSMLDERESRASSSGVTGSVDGSSMTGPSPAPDNDASSALQEVEQESAVTHYLVLKKFSDGTYLIKGITKLSQLAALCQKHKVAFKTTDLEKAKVVLTLKRVLRAEKLQQTIASELTGDEGFKSGVEQLANRLNGISFTVAAVATEPIEFLPSDNVVLPEPVKKVKPPGATTTDKPTWKRGQRSMAPEPIEDCLTKDEVTELFDKAEAVVETNRRAQSTTHATAFYAFLWMKVFPDDKDYKRTAVDAKKVKWIRATLSAKYPMDPVNEGVRWQNLAKPALFEKFTKEKTNEDGSAEKSETAAKTPKSTKKPAAKRKRVDTEDEEEEAAGSSDEEEEDYVSDKESTTTSEDESDLDDIEELDEDADETNLDESQDSQDSQEGDLDLDDSALDEVKTESMEE